MATCKREKKGLLRKNDRKARLRFARVMKRKVRQNSDLWTDEVAFSLDGTSFIHKYNPQSGTSCNKFLVWRSKGEGLYFKGFPRRLHVLDAIASGKGLTLEVQYEKVNRRFFALLIRRKFSVAQAGPKTSRRRLFTMDNDPSQRSKAAKALEDIEAELLEIPAG